MSDKTILVWFRNDLRIHDNEILFEASLKAAHIIPVYIFDPRYYVETSLGNKKTGIFRAKFILESVADLKNSLNDLGGDLLVLQGKPEEILPQIVKEYNVDEVYHHREVASEETEISSLVEDALWKNKINLKHFIGHTLFHKEDLPFPIKDIPDVFLKFRKKTDREGEIRHTIASPQKITIPENLKTSILPTLFDLGFDDLSKHETDDEGFVGGESKALNRLQHFLWNSDGLKSYKQNKNTSLGFNTTSKLSPWLSVGCISPRVVYWEVKKHEKQIGPTDSSNSFMVELLWRDYYRFMFKKHGTGFFYYKGSSADFENVETVKNYEKWKKGKTGVPFVDANIRQLKHTGYINFRGRVSVANYLVNTLKVNWTWGAEYFEELLIDYSPSSNWGNWANIGGVGNDQKELKILALKKQVKESDAKGEFMRSWLPEYDKLTIDELLELNDI